MLKDRDWRERVACRLLGCYYIRQGKTQAGTAIISLNSWVSWKSWIGSCSGSWFHRTCYFMQVPIILCFIFIPTCLVCCPSDHRRLRLDKAQGLLGQGHLRCWCRLQGEIQTRFSMVIFVLCSGGRFQFQILILLTLTPRHQEGCPPDPLHAQPPLHKGRPILSEIPHNKCLASRAGAPLHHTNNSAQLLVICPPRLAPPPLSFPSVENFSQANCHHYVSKLFWSMESCKTLTCRFIVNSTTSISVQFQNFRTSSPAVLEDAINVVGSCREDSGMNLASFTW